MNKRMLIICVSLCAVAILIGAFFDLGITQSLYLGDNAFSLICEVLSQTFMTFLTAFCFLVLFENFKNKTSFAMTCLKVGFVFASFILVLYDFYKIYNAVWFLVCAVFASCGIVYLMWLLARAIPEEKLPEYAKLSVKFIIFIALIFVLNQAVKYIWGRPRYTDLIATLTLEDYRPFWQPNFFSGYKSFYSGHTTAVCSILPLVYLVNKTNYNAKIKSLIKVGIIGIILLTMLSRLMAGDHFLTDVAFAFLISSLVSYFVFKKVK